MQDKRPKNEKGQRHGHWEMYRDDGSVWYICNYINGFWYGYFEHHRFPRLTREYYAR
jgi:hypothetical protein